VPEQDKAQLASEPVSPQNRSAPGLRFGLAAPPEGLNLAEMLPMTRSSDQGFEVQDGRHQPPRIVIVGGGFAGIAAARALRQCTAEIVLIDRRNHHIFQPLLYQVATAALAPSIVAAPIRQLVKQQKNLVVMMAEVTGVDLNSRSLDAVCPVTGTRKIAFDYLVLATGMRPSYFGHDEFAKHAPALKTSRTPKQFGQKSSAPMRRPEATDDEEERARLMTFVLVGGGPAGVELAGSIALMGSLTCARISGGSILRRPQLS
jgi:NADH dehydrogenase